MSPTRFQTLASKFPALRIAIVGDFCLDRYLEIDPARQEISIETGLAVHNVVNVRSQPGGAGTILNNLAALGIGEIYAVGFCGEDGEGFELRRALQARRGVRLDFFFQAPDRRTFTYTKPLVIESGKTPVELNRLDFKNWTPTPRDLSDLLERAVETLAERVDAIILLDQVDVAETGVVTTSLLSMLRVLAAERPDFLITADSRRGLQSYPPVTFKMNGAELGRLFGTEATSFETIRSQAAELAQRNGQRVFITLAERGIIGAAPDGQVEQVPALPLRGEIDVVGAGDAVTANLTAALAAGADLHEALVIAMHAASIVLHQLGTTGTASPEQISDLLQAGEIA
ncbi:MAG: PfkB family carbohydrate kinase [Verrucomicrobiota bacterium]